MVYFQTDPEPTTFNILIRCIIYIIVNSAQPLLVDTMKYNGAASTSTFIYVIPTYLPMVIVGLTPRKKSIWNEGKRFWNITILTLCDLAHQLIEKAGLIYSGSAVYMMAASSSSVWVALLSRIILKKKISSSKWLGIFLICIGLSLKGFQVTQTAGKNEIFGASLTLFAALLHALTTVFNEKILTEKEAIEGLDLVFISGMVSTTLISIWTIFWTIPRWNSLVVKNITLMGGSPKIAIICFLLLLVCGMFRSAILWYLIKHTGAITTGVLKGIRTPTVFFLSHLLFCHVDTSQCISQLKTVAAILCSLGVFFYSLNISRKEEPEEKLPLINNSIVSDKSKTQ